jgi:phosphopentomutase
LVDFDALWGHRRDAVGYGKEIERFDRQLGQLIEKMKMDDLIILTADHGNDPTFIGTDHTRENVPFIAYSPSLKQPGPLTERSGFGAVGATIAENFKVERPSYGESYLKELI